MKQHSPTRAQETQTTVTDVVRWTKAIGSLACPDRSALCPARTASSCARGSRTESASTTSRKNGGPLAEHAQRSAP
jgi:hypothetical protein